MNFNYQHRSCILGPSTLWLIYPVINNIYNIINFNNIIFIEKIIIYNILIVTIASLVNWYFIGKNKLYVCLDLLFARSLFCFIIYYYFYYLNYSYIIIINFPILIFTTYFLAKIFYKFNYILISTLFHYTFRFIGYWWIFIAFNYNIINNNFDNFVLVFVTNSIIYYIYFVYFIIYFNSYYLYYYNTYFYINECINTIYLIIINHSIIYNI